MAPCANYRETLQQPVCVGEQKCQNLTLQCARGSKKELGRFAQRSGRDWLTWRPAERIQSRGESVSAVCGPAVGRGFRESPIFASA